MDDDLRQLEAELEALRPAAPPAALTLRVQRELGPATTRPGSTAARVNRREGAYGWWLAALPAAAAVALVFAIKGRPPTAAGPARERPSSPVAVAASDGATFKPVAVQNVLYAADDEGLVTLDDGSAARRERRHFVDTITWRNPRTNASLTWSVPREEVRIVPVRLQ